jgi:sugar lactone lactonase YvrE
MDTSEEKSDGKLWMVNRDGSFEEKLDNLAIPNGLDWTSDHMFYIDSPTKSVVKFDYETSTGQISNKTVLLTIPDGTGVPDGMTVSPDKKYALVAHWGGFGVYIYDATSGNLLRKISLPTAHTTSCVWIGNDLYVTSAKKGRSVEQLAQEKHAGGASHS